MIKDKIDRRKSKRFFFTLKQGVSVQLNKTKKQSSSPIPATLLSLSEGGVCFSMDKKYLSTMIPGDHFVLQSSEASEPLKSLHGIEMKIKHIQDCHIYVNISCGFEFTKISGGKKKKIQNWIARRMKETT